MKEEDPVPAGRLFDTWARQPIRLRNGRAGAGAMELYLCSVLQDRLKYLALLLLLASDLRASKSRHSHKHLHCLRPSPSSSRSTSLPAPPSYPSPTAMSRKLCEVVGCQVQPSYGPSGTYTPCFLHFQYLVLFVSGR